MNFLKSIFSFLILSPFSFLYGIIVGVRNYLFNTNILKHKEFKIPIICIGNISVGGTGKTPHSEFLIKALTKENFKVACISRGYKRKTKGMIIATEHSTANEIGDEPNQIKQKFPSITVIVDKKRTRAINYLVNSNNPPDIIILDDAFQHRYVKSNISILLTEYSRPFYNDYIMPLGRLRESRMAKNRANIIIVTKCPSNITPIERRIVSKNINVKPYQELYFSYMNYGDIIPVFPSIYDDTTEVPECTSVLLLTGIANPKPLLEQTKNVFENVVQLNFPDHHNFSTNDIKLIERNFENIKSEQKIILTTEKDAMRLKTVQLPNKLKRKLFYIPIDISFIDNRSFYFIKNISEYAKKNKRVL